MSRTAFPAFLALILVVGCNVGSGGRVIVKGAGPDDLLKLRSGPGLNHRVIVGLPDGTELNRRGCRTERGQTWCHVSLADSPGVTGYVSADYLAVF
ncbi:SH3 domain-containing protein [Paracoccus salsus]|uniref:SH3 domain-containing protein n=1 Tax=Paracoccus salsus TaxID=2911061 RepID=UPI001F45832B|nr:SH3 domain-containing protein [Paracoccus salsus]MCF3973964.1 SH3 domain-containing protein [Paracoccus salsus]